MAPKKLQCVCGEFASKPWAVVNQIPIVECSCGVCRVESVDPDKYISLYTSGKYHAEGSDDLPHASAGREPHVSRFDTDYEVAKKRVDKLLRYVNPDIGDSDLLLDVGCANGAFMTAAAEAGFTVSGCDLSSDAAPSWSKFIRCGDLRTVGFQRRSKAVITFNDSFEHFIDPLSALKAACGILKRNGILVIEIPDMGSKDAIEQGVRFKHVKPHEHLWYFTATQLRELLESEGFIVVGMDVPINGKVTVYASPIVAVTEVDIYGPPGVGDTLWTLQKLKAIYENESPCRIRFIVCSSGEDKVVTRAKDFLLLCPYISAVEHKNLAGQPLPRDVGCEDPSRPIYELFPNDHLEPKVAPFAGKCIEEWRPELADDWEPPFEVPQAALLQTRLRLGHFYGKHVAVYMSSHVWNNVVSMPHWSPRHWAELLIRISQEGFKPVIVGAGQDSAYASDVATEIVRLGRIPSSVWINAIGRTTLPLAMAYMQTSAVTIGVANGLPMLPLYTGGKAIIFWPTRGLSNTKATFCPEFEYNWLNPQIRKSGRYTALVVGQLTVDSFMEHIRRAVSTDKANAAQGI